MEEGWKEIYMTAHEYKAEMAKEKLEEANIKVVVLNHHDSMIKTLGEYQLFVAEENVAKAVELLKSLKGE